ncbi:DEAD/DEAH box helicase [Lactimicrobium sp.]
MKEMRPVQQECIPLLKQGRNLYCQAHTGAGKTAAYLLPALDKIQENRLTQVLILAPTRELAMQIEKNAQRLSVFTRIHTVCLIGGMPIEKQENLLKQGAELVIGTPGRLLDLIHQDKLDLSNVIFTIIDEADMMAGTGQNEETNQILSMVNGQRAVFSATLHEDVKAYLPQPYEQVILDDASLSHNIKPYYIASQNKKETLLDLLQKEKIEQAIIFVNHRSDANNLSDILSHHNILCSAFSAYFDEAKRLSILDHFQKGEIRVLCATDAAARGLDLTSISMVIHYDLPADMDTFLHRSGRSGHQEQSGMTIALLDTEDQNSDIGKEIMAMAEPYPWQNNEENDLSVPIEKEKTDTPDATEIQLSLGKKDGMRLKDVIGALCARIPFEKIGRVQLQDHYCTVVLFMTKEAALTQLENLTIKKKKVRVQIRRKSSLA